MSARRELDEFIQRVERLRDMNTRVAKAAEKPIADAIRETATAGTTPTGEKWPELKEGGRALPNAAEAVSSKAKTAQVVITLKKPYGFHQRGDGLPRRQIVPAAGEPIPPAINEAIAQAAKDVFGKAMGG